MHLRTALSLGTLALLAAACGPIGRAIVGGGGTAGGDGGGGTDVVRDGPVQMRPDSVPGPADAGDDCVMVTAWDAGGAGPADDGGGAGDDAGAGCMLGADCDQGGTITGVVHAPNGTDPIVGAYVYPLPPGGDAPLPTGPACVACDPPATACTSARTRVDGSFTLEGLPTGMQTFVVRKGLFRREFTMNVTCGITAASPDDTRLPRNHLEGALPRIAVATGDYDELECVLARAGIDPAEVALFNNTSDASLVDPTRPTLHALLSDPTMLAGFQVLVANCSANTDGLYSDTTALANLEHFVAQGGRLVATDWSYDLIEQVPQFAPAVCWQGTTCCNELPEPASIADVGMSESAQVSVLDPTMSAWLRQVGAAGADGTAQVDGLAGGWAVQASIATPTRALAQGMVEGASRPLVTTFDYAGCGRVFYSSFHTLGRDDCPSSGCQFPNYCPPVMAAPQERVMEYLLFDATTCVPPAE